MVNDKSSYEWDELSKFIGSYTLIFQHIENSLNQCLQLMTSHEYWNLIHAINEKLTFNQKLEIVRSNLCWVIDNEKDDIKNQWLKEDVLPTFKKIESVMSQRNDLMHAGYIYELFEHGGPIIGARKRVKKDGLKFKYTPWTKEKMGTELTNISQISYDVGMILVQLRMWSEMFIKKTIKTNSKPI